MNHTMSLRGIGVFSITSKECVGAGIRSNALPGHHRKKAIQRKDVKSSVGFIGNRRQTGNPMFKTINKPSRSSFLLVRHASRGTVQEQDKSRPKHGKSLKLMYVFYGLTCVVERTWRFAVPLLVGKLLSTSVPAMEIGGDGGVDMAYEAVAVIGFLACQGLLRGGWPGAS